MAGKYDHINFKPPASVAKAAKRGLELRRKNKGKGGLSAKQASKQGIGSGVQRASNLKSRSNLSPKTVRRMKSFFDRHKKNKKIDPGKTHATDSGYIAWMLWGGDPGYSWARKIVRQMDAADKKPKKESINLVRAELLEKTFKPLLEEKSKKKTKKKDQDGDGDKDFADIMIARMVASGMTKAKAIKKAKKHDTKQEQSLNDLYQDPQKFGIDLENMYDPITEPELYRLQIVSEAIKIIQEKQNKKDSAHRAGYKAPEGSERDKLLDRAKELYKQGKKKEAQKLRDRMEKMARSKPGYKTRKSKYTNEVLQITEMNELQNLLEETLDEIHGDNILEGFSAKTKKSLKNKAKKHNAPYGALATVYRKGLGAYTSSGSRPGMTSAQWAMARVNSFLKGGPARRVDKAQWEKVKKHRKKRKSK